MIRNIIDNNDCRNYIYTEICFNVIYYDIEKVRINIYANLLTIVCFNVGYNINNVKNLKGKK